MKHNQSDRQERSIMPNSINLKSPRVLNCLKSHNRKLYCELVQEFPKRKPDQLAQHLNDTIREGLLEGKHPEDLKVELAPLLRRPIAQSLGYVQSKIDDTLRWLSYDPDSESIDTGTPPPQRGRPTPSSFKPTSVKPPSSRNRASTLAVKELSDRARLIRERYQVTKIQDDQRLVLSFSYNYVEGTGRYCVKIATGEEIHRDFEAATLRHFQLQMLDDVFSKVVPSGNVVLECDDTGLVEHFNLRNWVAYPLVSG